MASASVPLKAAIPAGTPHSPRIYGHRDEAIQAESISALATCISPEWRS